MMAFARPPELLLPLPPHHPLDWWNGFSILTDSPEKRALREQTFRQEAKLLFERGSEALSEEEARAIWADVIRRPVGKKSGKSHDPDGDAHLLYLFNCQVEKRRGRTHGAKAATVNEFHKLKPHVTRAAIIQHLDRLLEKRETERKKWQKYMAALAAVNLPSLLSIANPIDTESTLPSD